MQTVTDSEGQFQLPEVPAGVIDLKVTLSGYASVVEPIDVYPTEAALVQLPPYPSPGQYTPCSRSACSTSW